MVDKPKALSGRESAVLAAFKMGGVKYTEYPAPHWWEMGGKDVTPIVFRLRQLGQLSRAEWCNATEGKIIA